MNARIIAAASVFPEHRVDAGQVKETLRRVFGALVPELEHYCQAIDRCGIESRHLVLPVEETTRRRPLGEKNAFFGEKCRELGMEVASKCLAQAGVAAGDVDALFTVSCTGFMIPSLDAYLATQLGFRPDVVRMPVNEMGCAAGAWALARCRERAQAVPKGLTLLVSVELPSLTFQPDDLSGANVLSSILFGDGAVAVLVSSGEAARPGIELEASRSILFKDTTHLMGFDLDDTGFHIVLDREIPDLIAKRALPELERFLADHELTRGDVGFWVIHPGGAKILESIARSLDLGARELAPTLRVWSSKGNLSSATVLCIFEEFMRTPPEPGSRGLAVAFGPGFCMEMLLLRAVEGAVS
jgi:alkylresorcinol/alkylpyrone synthase